MWRNSAGATHHALFCPVSVCWSPDHSPPREVLPPSLYGGGSGWGKGKLPRAALLAKDTARAEEQLCPAG